MRIKHGRRVTEALPYDDVKRVFVHETLGDNTNNGTYDSPLRDSVGFAMMCLNSNRIMRMVMNVAGRWIEV